MQHHTKRDNKRLVLNNNLKQRKQKPKLKPHPLSTTNAHNI